MSSSNKRHKYWTNTTQTASIGLLFLLPKCSLCIFAVSNAIAVCGLKPIITPFWEYLLIGLFLIIHLGMMVYEMRNGWKALPIIMTGLALTVLLGFLIFNLSSIYYYAGVILVSVGWIILKTQNAQNCNDGCSDTSDGIAFSTIDKT